MAVNADGTAALVGARDDDTAAGRTDVPAVDTYDVGSAYLFRTGEPLLIFEEQTVTGDTVTVSRVEMPEAGFVVIASTDGEAVYGVSEHLSAGSATDLQIPLDQSLPGDGTYLAVGVADSDGDEHFDASRVREKDRLQVEGRPVADIAELTLEDG